VPGRPCRSTPESGAAVLWEPSYAGKRTAPTNPPAPSLRVVHMSLPKLAGHAARESAMDLFAGMPEWLVWCAAGIAGAIALTALANMLAAALDAS
jgi:hypothetical protein